MTAVENETQDGQRAANSTVMRRAIGGPKERRRRTASDPVARASRIRAWPATAYAVERFLLNGGGRCSWKSGDTRVSIARPARPGPFLSVGKLMNAIRHRRRLINVPPSGGRPCSTVCVRFPCPPPRSPPTRIDAVNYNRDRRLAFRPPTNPGCRGKLILVGAYRCGGVGVGSGREGERGPKRTRATDARRETTNAHTSAAASGTIKFWRPCNRGKIALSTVPISVAFMRRVRVERYGNMSHRHFLRISFDVPTAARFGVSPSPVTTLVVYAQTIFGVWRFNRFKLFRCSYDFGLSSPDERRSMRQTYASHIFLPLGN